MIDDKDDAVAVEDDPKDGEGESEKDRSSKFVDTKDGGHRFNANSGRYIRAGKPIATK